MRNMTNNLQVKSISLRVIQLVGLMLAQIVWASWIAPSGHASTRSSPSVSGAKATRRSPFEFVTERSRPLASSASKGTSEGLSVWTTNGPKGGTVTSLVIDPGNPRVLYAGTRSGVFKSTDNGGSWSRLDGLPNSFQYDPYLNAGTALAIDPLHTSTIYAGISEHGLFKSNDAGASWSAINTDLPKDFPVVNALAVDPVNTDTVYAVVNGNIYKSTNAGAAWQFLGIFFVSVNTLTIAPGKPATIYVTGSDCWSDPGAGCLGFIAWSADDGASWDWRSCYCAQGFGAAAVDPHDANTVYFGHAGSVLKTSDGGAHWKYLGDGLSTDYSFNFVNSLAIDPVNPNIIYAGTDGVGVFKSTDGGLTWVPFNEGLTNSFVNVLAIGSAGKNLHAGTQMGVFHYRDTTNCDYSISNLGQSFSMQPGSGSVSVNSSNDFCDWQVVNDANWITITSGATGAGNGNVNFSVAANTAAEPRTATLTIAGRQFIVNQSGLPPSNLIDDPQYFVRQHYLDFLNREPDQDGLAFWNREIVSCRADVQCVEVKRVNVSAAYFLSIEFQQTGYLVYRLYKARTAIYPALRFRLSLRTFCQTHSRLAMESSSIKLAGNKCSRPISKT